MSFKPDCIIVGSGPLGALSARRLDEGGLKVLILEAGESVSAPPGSHLRNQMRYQKNPDDFFMRLMIGVNTLIIRLPIVGCQVLISQLY